MCRRLEESGAVANGFDIAGNHPDIVVFGEMREIVGEGQADLIAAGDEIGNRGAAALNATAQRLHEHAALRDDSDRAAGDDVELLIGNRRELRPAHGEAHTIGSDRGDSRTAEGIFEPVRPSDALMISAFAKASGKKTGAARAQRRCCFDRSDRLLGGEENSEMIGLFRQRGKR